MQYKIETINLKQDYEGDATATLICAPAQNTGKAILYIHGYADYFFQDHMADYFTAVGYNFYALELRKYGRSLLPHQRMNYCRDISEYFEEISLAIERITADGNTQVVLMGHSTGGLIASLYTAKGAQRDKISALVLNSPFLEFNSPPPIKYAALGAAYALKPFKYASMGGGISPLYLKSLHKKYHGEWEFNLTWKGDGNFRIYFSWILAIRRAQNELKAGLGLKIPVLLMHSERSAWPGKWNEDCLKCDIVLDVAHMKKFGGRIGDNVTFCEIKDGLHDLMLSRKDVREKALSEALAWLKQH